MERSMQWWIFPWIGVIAYPGFLLAFDAAINRYHGSGSPAMAASAVLAMLLAGSIPVLAIRALLNMRHDAGPVLTRGMLYLIVGAPSLFSLTLTVMRLAGVKRYGAIGVWICAWLTVGLMLYLRKGQGSSTPHERQVPWLRVLHGVAALCLLCGFLLAHLSNHGLAVWSVELHGAVLDWLRLWYRSAWVEPVLLTLLLIMIGSGVPMVARYSRQPMDAFRVIQVATGAYVAVFICSHVVATLNGRRLGIETDWSFAAGPTSLLDGTPLLGRLIPHYMFGTFCLVLHVGFGLRGVLLQHGVTRQFGNRALYGVASVGALATVLIAAALMGVHINAQG